MQKRHQLRIHRAVLIAILLGLALSGFACWLGSATCSQATLSSEGPPTIIPAAAPECRLRNLLECSSFTPVFVPGESNSSARLAAGGVLEIAFSNAKNGSGLALQFRPGLKVRTTHVEMTGTSSRAFTF